MIPDDIKNLLIQETLKKDSTLGNFGLMSADKIGMGMVQPMPEPTGPSFMKWLNQDMHQDDDE